MFPLLLATAAMAEAPPATLTACPDPPPVMPAGAASASRAVVRVETLAGSGSGVVVAPDGWILTASHVLRGADEAKVVFADGSTSTGQVVRGSAFADLSLLHVAASPPCLPLATTPAAPGDDVYVLGSPGGAALTHSLTKGIASAWRVQDGWTVLQTDASINAGNSGGPVLDATGHVQGIVVRKQVGVGVEGIGFALGVQDLRLALGLRVSDTTDVSTWVATSGAPGGVEGGTLGGLIGVRSVQHRPETPGPIRHKNACKKGHVKMDDSAFGATHRAEKGPFRLTWKDGERGTFEMKRFFFGAVPTSSGANLPAGRAAVDLALADGTTIHLVNTGGSARFTMMGTDVWSTFALTDDVLRALASSPVEAFKWSGADGASDAIDVSGGDGKVFWMAAACLAEARGLE